MARKVQIVLEDDLDGSPAQRSLSFGFDGVDYEIDLSIENAKKLEQMLAPYIDKARKSKRSGGRGRKRAASTAGTSDAGAIRAWARENGFEVSERGRVPREVREAYLRDSQ